MLVGYVRVSTVEQNNNLQKDALKKAGCKKIFSDSVSGVKAERPGLEAALDFMRKGDILVVWRLDRLGRSIQDLLSIVSRLELKETAFKSLTEAIDASTSTGRLIFHIFGAMAEFERNLIRERTCAGLMAARARGRVGGRPKKLNASKVELVKKLYKDRKHSIKQISEMVGISRSSIYNYIEVESPVKSKSKKVEAVVAKSKISKKKKSKKSKRKK
jgi:DNA invertase Pin-like site-specific DNA recombinase